MVHVVRVVLEGPSEKGITTVRLAGGARVAHYLDAEAPSSGVCAALEATSRAVATYEIPVHDGLLVRIDIERNGEVHSPAYGFCTDCDPLAHDIEWSLKSARENEVELRAALKRLADAAELVTDTDSDITPAEFSMDFENALREARQLLKEAT